ncbi:MAG TPA: class I SAM-dependent methyltransferase [Steroidobacteraceae bacterium]|nr:class I SAM-dependent methyltransferase [Steroidobacteraceae bacterium]
MNTGVSFGLASDAYKSFRIEYPPALFTQIEHAGTSMRRNLAVDLGSGTGLSLPPLLQRFDRVIAVEPDARMAEKIAHHEKLEINVSRAEKFDIDSGRVDLITCATAFYWMDGPTVINHMIRWLHPDGLIAVYRYGFPKLPGTVANIVYRELEQHWNAFRSPRLIDEEYTWRCFTSSDKLKDLSRVNIPNVVTMDASALTGFFSSTSYCSAYMRSIENAESYLAAFRKELLEAAGNDQLRVDFEVELVTAHRC